MEPRETDIGRVVRRLTRARIALFLIFWGLILAFCLYATIAFGLAGLWEVGMGGERRHTYVVDGGTCWTARIGRWLLRAAVWCQGEGRTKGQNLRQPTCVSSRVPVPVVLARQGSVRHNQQAHQRRSRHPPRNTAPEGSRRRSARWRPHRAGTPQARCTGYRDHATVCAGFQSTCCSKRSRSLVVCQRSIDGSVRYHKYGGKPLRTYQNRTDRPLAQHWQYPSPNTSCPLLCRAGIAPIAPPSMITDGNDRRVPTDDVSTLWSRRRRRAGRFGRSGIRCAR